MRSLMLSLIGVLLFSSGCSVLNPQRREERKECRHRLRERIVECVKPGPIIWGGAHPVTPPPSKPYQGPDLRFLTPIVPALLGSVVK